MTDSYTNTNTKKAPEQSIVSQGESRSRRSGSDAFREFMGSDWGPRITKEIEYYGVADYLPQRTVGAGKPFAGEHLIIPIDIHRVRNSDCTYRFRTHSAFAHLSGLGGEHKPDSVPVLEPKKNDSHEAILYSKPRTPYSAQEFYSGLQYGEFWVGAHPSLKGVH